MKKKTPTAQPAASNATSVQKIFDWLLCSEDGLTDYQLLTFLWEGGMV